MYLFDNFDAGLNFADKAEGSSNGSGAERIAGCSALKCSLSLSILTMLVKNGSAERDGRMFINV
jgi:hypothetical protein